MSRTRSFQKRCRPFRPRHFYSAEESRRLVNYLQQRIAASHRDHHFALRDKPLCEIGRGPEDCSAAPASKRFCACAVLSVRRALSLLVFLSLGRPSATRNRRFSASLFEEIQLGNFDALSVLCHVVDVRAAAAAATRLPFSTPVCEIKKKKKKTGRLPGANLNAHFAHGRVHINVRERKGMTRVSIGKYVGAEIPAWRRLQGSPLRFPVCAPREHARRTSDKERTPANDGSRMRGAVPHGGFSRCRSAKVCAFE